MAASNSLNPTLMTEAQFLSPDYTPCNYIGRAIIINNYTFNKLEENKKKTRDQKTLRDSEELQKTLHKLGFCGMNEDKEPTLLKDLTKSELQTKLKEAAQNNFKDHSSLVCVISSYGLPGVIYCPGESGTFKDDKIELQEIQKFFKPQNCSDLTLKPKIFMIRSDNDYMIKDKPMAKGKADDLVKHSRKIPSDCDFLTIQSTEPARWEEDNKTLSPFIHSICKCLTNYWGKEKMDLLKVMTRINNNFIQFQESATRKPIDSYPQVTSLLIKQFKWHQNPIN